MPADGERHKRSLKVEGKAPKKPSRSVFFDESISRAEKEDLTATCSSHLRVLKHFDKTLSYVVTKQKDWQRFTEPKLHASSPLDTQSPAFAAAAESAGPAVACSRLTHGTSRSKLMVAKAADKRGSLAESGSVLALAQKFNIVILHITQFRKKFCKKNGEVQNRKGKAPKQGRNEKHYEPLGRCFIKVEDCSGQYAPLIGIYPPDKHGQPTHPRLHLDNPPGHCLFVKASKNAKPKTAKSSAKRKRFIRKRDPVGHCGICHVPYYGGLEAHAATEAHRKVACDPRTFEIVRQRAIRCGLTLKHFQASEWFKSLESDPNYETDDGEWVDPDLVPSAASSIVNQAGNKEKVASPRMAEDVSKMEAPPNAGIVKQDETLVSSPECRDETDNGAQSGVSVLPSDGHSDGHGMSENSTQRAHVSVPPTSRPPSSAQQHPAPQIVRRSPRQRQETGSVVGAPSLQTPVQQSLPCAAAQLPPPTDSALPNPESEHCSGTPSVKLPADLTQTSRVSRLRCRTESWAEKTKTQVHMHDTIPARSTRSRSGVTSAVINGRHSTTSATKAKSRGKKTVQKQTIAPKKNLQRTRQTSPMGELDSCAPQRKRGPGRPRKNRAPMMVDSGSEETDAVQPTPSPACRSAAKRPKSIKKSSAKVPETSLNPTSTLSVVLNLEEQMAASDAKRCDAPAAQPVEAEGLPQKVLSRKSETALASQAVLALLGELSSDDHDKEHDNSLSDWDCMRVDAELKTNSTSPRKDNKSSESPDRHRKTTHSVEVDASPDRHVPLPLAVKNLKKNSDDTLPSFPALSDIDTRAPRSLTSTTTRSTGSAMAKSCHMTIPDSCTSSTKADRRAKRKACGDASETPQDTKKRANLQRFLPVSTPADNFTRAPLRPRSPRTEDTPELCPTAISRRPASTSPPMWKPELGVIDSKLGVDSVPRKQHRRSSKHMVATSPSSAHKRAGRSATKRTYQRLNKKKPFALINATSVEDPFEFTD